jgi:hypothetical protein
MCHDNVNVSDRSVPTTKKNTEALVVASKETGLEVNAEKPEYMVAFQDRNARQNYNKHW